MNTIDVQQVVKRFGSTTVLDGVNLAVPQGSITAVLGASGSGKTTLLRLIAGFEYVDTGAVAIGGETVDDGQSTVRSQHRGVGFVPQDAALFPHLTAVGNVGFGLPRRDRGRARELLDLVGLGKLERRYPHELSGGQQQRVALARALAIRPKVVLLDEPFSSLDASLRVDLRRDVARILTETGTTTILVTHDQDEALAVSDRIALLADGRVLACAEPQELYRHPPGIAAAALLGEANIIAAQLQDGHAVSALGVLATTDASSAQGPGQLLLRPEQLVVHVAEAPATAPATVQELRYHGHDALVQLQLQGADGETVVARVPGELSVATGQRVWVEVSGPARAWPAAASAD